MIGELLKAAFYKYKSKTGSIGNWKYKYDEGKGPGKNWQSAAETEMRKQHTREQLNDLRRNYHAELVDTLTGMKAKASGSEIDRYDTLIKRHSHLADAASKDPALYREALEQEIKAHTTEQIGRTFHPKFELLSNEMEGLRTGGGDLYEDIKKKTFEGMKHEFSFGDDTEPTLQDFEEDPRFIDELQYAVSEAITEREEMYADLNTKFDEQIEEAHATIEAKMDKIVDEAQNYATKQVDKVEALREKKPTLSDALVYSDTLDEAIKESKSQTKERIALSKKISLRGNAMSATLQKALNRNALVPRRVMRKDGKMTTVWVKAGTSQAEAERQVHAGVHDEKPAQPRRREETTDERFNREQEESYQETLADANKWINKLDKWKKEGKRKIIAPKTGQPVTLFYYYRSDLKSMANDLRRAIEHRLYKQAEEPDTASKHDVELDRLRGLYNKVAEGYNRLLDDDAVLDPPKPKVNPQSFDDWLNKPKGKTMSKAQLTLAEWKLQKAGIPSDTIIAEEEYSKPTTLGDWRELLKAKKGGDGLVAKKVSVNRGGKTHMQTVWVKPGSAEAKMKPSAASDAETKAAVHVLQSTVTNQLKFNERLAEAKGDKDKIHALVSEARAHLVEHYMGGSDVFPKGAVEEVTANLVKKAGGQDGDTHHDKEAKRKEAEAGGSESGEGGEFKAQSIADMRRISKENDDHFFDTATMKHFNSVIHGGANKDGYFISSEQTPGSNERSYNVRRFNSNTGKSETVGNYNEHKSLDAAKDALKGLGSKAAGGGKFTASSAKQSAANETDHTQHKDFDKPAATELELYMENDPQFYRQTQSILENMARKIKNGSFDASRAPALVAYMIDTAAKKYNKEFGSDGDNIFTSATRKGLAQSMAKDLEKQIRQGSTDHDSVNKIYPGDGK